MITIDLNLNPNMKKIQIKDDILFNALLSQNKSLIKKLLKRSCRSYKVSDTFFEIVNNFVDFNSNGISMYGGLIVRTGLVNYAVLYLEDAALDEDYMIELIDEYIHDKGDYRPDEVDVTKFEIKRDFFLNTLKKL